MFTWDTENGGKGYPMVMQRQKVAQKIVNAVLGKRRVAVVDWRYRVLVALWSCIPRFLWKRFPLKAKP